jgi:DNA-binding NarL/FixJ family response regulator
MNRRYKVLICDDHAEFRDLVKTVLQRNAQIEIVGEAGNGDEAVKEALRLRPDVVLMDLNMPKLSGLEATRRIRRASRHIKILIVSALESEEAVSPCLNAGASGFFQKFDALSDLSHAIELVSNGEAYLSRPTFGKVSRAGGMTF